MEKSSRPSSSPDSPTTPQVPVPPRVLPIAIVGGVLGVLAVGWALVHRAESEVNTVALASTPKPVTTIVARAAMYRETRTYVGTLRPWVEANVGPQFISAYVDTVLVRPGASVKRNEVLATLDCRNASTSSLSVAAEARAIDARQKAIAHESTRLNSLLDGGFVSPNEAEQKEAQSASEGAQLASERAKLAGTSLAVSDCVLRAPFEGEISIRSIDPGAFVHPGTPIVTIVDRSTVRVTFDVPETDFDSVAQKTPVSIQVLATGKAVVGTVARRSPAADPDTRTVHAEVDLDNTNHDIPVNTTAEVEIQVGQPKPTVEVPLVAASMTGSKATLFVVEGGVARERTFEIQGEEGSNLYLEKGFKAGSRVVTEGRALLRDGDRVTARDAVFGASLASSQPSPPKVGSQEVTP
jgi:membrane fusion protein (multidrug efflux system)